MGYIEAICLSEKKGTPKHEVFSADLRTDWGIVHDAHAGNWHRQISLLAGEDIDTVKEKIPELKIGAFAENLITRGIDLTQIPIGGKLRIGEDILLEITQIGKECHSGCAIQKITGDCIMPRRGIFARVLKGGKIKPKDNLDLT